MSENQKKAYLDLAVFLLFLITSAPQATGVALHEWLGFALVPVILVHLLMSWRWIVGTTLRIFAKLPGKIRFNHLWDTLIFIIMTIIIFSGVVVSEIAVPQMGIPIVVDPFWLAVHHITSNLFLLLLGIHLAMHWDWVVNAWKLYVLRRSSDRTPTNVEESWR